MSRFVRSIDSVTARTAAWAVVESAQLALNQAAEQQGPLAKEVEAYHAARIQYEAAPRGSEVSAEAWRTVASKQEELNRAAINVLPAEVAALNAALEQYVGVDGSKDRKPGVGGLS